MRRTSTPRDTFTKTFDLTCFGCGQMGSTLMGAAAKVMNFDRLGNKVRPGTFGKINRQVNGSAQKVPLSNNMKFAVTPMALTPFVPFRVIYVVSTLAGYRPKTM